MNVPRADAAMAAREDRHDSLSVQANHALRCEHLRTVRGFESGVRCSVFWVWGLEFEVLESGLRA